MYQSKLAQFYTRTNEVQPGTDDLGRFILPVDKVVFITNSESGQTLFVHGVVRAVGAFVIVQPHPVFAAYGLDSLYEVRYGDLLRFPSNMLFEEFCDYLRMLNSIVITQYGPQTLNGRALK